MNLLTAVPFASVFEGEPETPPEPTPKPEIVPFSDAQQRRVNAILADERRKDEAKRSQLALQLESEKAAREKLAAENETLKGKYAGKVRDDALTAAAAEAKAANPRLVTDFLRTMTRVEEVTGEDGAPTGEFRTFTKLGDKDYSPADAIKTLKESPDYASLFLSPASAGLGGFNSPRAATGGSRPVHEMSTAEYMAERRKARAAGARPR